MKKYFWTLLALILMGCNTEEPISVSKKKGKWPLIINQPIQIQDNDSVFYKEDLLLKLDPVLEIVTSEGFSVDWNRDSNSFNLRTKETLPLGGFLSIITESEEISFPLIGNGPIENETYFTGENMLSGISSSDGSITFSASSPDVGYIFFHNNDTIGGIDKAGDIITVKIPDAAKEYERSYLRAYSWNKNGWGQDIHIPLSYGKMITDANKLDRKDYHANRMYFVLLDRFNNGDPGNDAKVVDDRLDEKTNYFGGDIKGVTEKIRSGYFDSLNINAIWLSPITQNPEEAFREFPEPRRWYSGYHGYWPIRSGIVDHRFGTEEDMKELVQVAHDHDISILLDYICNHIHQNHPLYQAHPEYATSFDLPDGSKNIRLWDEQRLTTWFDDFLPSLDLSNPEVIELQSDSALYWMQKYHLDGFRHDATKHIPEVFWKTLTRKIKDSIIIPENRPVYQIGETYADPELIVKYIGNGILDAQFDFNLFFTTRDQIAKENGDLNEVARRLKESLRFYGYHNTMGYISGNHDQPRFTAYASGALSFDEDPRQAGFSRYIGIDDSIAFDKMAQLIAFNNAIPGIPVLYYGDEIGMSGAGDPDNRRPMRFDGWTSKESNLWNKVAGVNALRASSMALTYGDLEILHHSQTRLVLKRSYFGETVIFALNTSPEPFECSLSKSNMKGMDNADPYFNTAKAQRSDNNELKIELPGNSFDFILNTSKK